VAADIPSLLASYDAAGAAATAQATAESFATSAVVVETSRAEAAEALLAPKANPTFIGTVSGITAAMVGADASGLAAAALATAEAYTDSSVSSEASARATAVTNEASARATADGLLVPKTTKVNGHALSGDVTVTTSDLSLATVATSGSYTDLSNKPTIPAAQVETDWNASSGMGQLLNKPTLATVATSGSYADLSNKPTLAQTVNAQTASSYTAVLGDANNTVTMTYASGCVFNVDTNTNVAFPVGTVLIVIQNGAGQVTLTALSGVTVLTASSLTTRAQYSTVTLEKIATNTWIVGGDLT